MPENARKERGYAVFEQKEKHICLAYKCVFLHGAEDEIRTRDVHLGKVTLYH